MARKTLWFCILLCCTTFVRAQQVWLRIYNPSEDKDIIHITGDVITEFESEATRTIALNKYLQDLYSLGYLTAAYQPITDRNDTLAIQFAKGEKVHWASLSVDQEDEHFLTAAGYSAKDFKGTVFRFDEVENIFKKVLSWSENSGYPFATVQLDSIQWRDSIVQAKLEYRPHQFFVFDSVRVVGDVHISKNYIAQYTGIQAEHFYDQELISSLDKRLREITFVSVTRPSQIEFSGDRARVIIYLDEKQSSRFDFIIGVMPNEAITGRFIVTGEGRLDLQNVFGTGEAFNIHFSKLESTSKELQTHVLYPYLPGTPLGAEAAFNLYLKDSAYLEQSASAGFIYQFVGNNNLKALVHFYNSTILTIDTAYIINYKILPASLDVHSRSYGLEWNFEKLNYRYNPRKGYSIKLNGAAGSKIIKENSSIVALVDPDDPSFDFSTLYDSLDLKMPTFNVGYNLEWFIPIAQHAALLLQARGASLIADRIVQNELMLIGGNALLRGFDERSLPVSQYYIFTVEGRYLLSQNSYASLFADAGYTENVAATPALYDHPVGFGAGVNFETKAGIFGLSYALGMQSGNPLSLKNTKIHFGYVNYF